MFQKKKEKEKIILFLAHFLRRSTPQFCFSFFFSIFLFFSSKILPTNPRLTGLCPKKKRKEKLSLIDLLSNVDELSLLYLGCSFVFVGFACCRIVKLGVAALLALVFDCRSLID